MWNHEIFLKNVELLLDRYCGGSKTKGSQKIFNDRIGDRDAVSKWKGGNKPSLETLLKISDKFSVSLDWLVLGNDNVVREQPTLVIQETPKFKTYHRDFSLNNYVPVRLLKDSVAAGVPAEIREWDVEGWALIYADREWMPHNPENYTCCRVQGSSMYPILSDGDIVAIDHAERDPRRLDKKMVVFRKDGGVTIKWLKVLKDGSVVGVPENKDDFDSVVSLRGDEIVTGIVGKVSWWWAKRK
ncbi:MAG: S24 family peptidase [Eubacteriales bacterium]|nr:S24 family peptidase [Eubacteriales bacterium]